MKTKFKSLILKIKKTMIAARIAIIRDIARGEHIHHETQKRKEEIFLKYAHYGFLRLF